jgi:DNA-binding CsgD family transcriptional regulator
MTFFTRWEAAYGIAAGRASDVGLLIGSNLAAQPDPAELEVVRLVSEGLRNDAIARRLFIAPGTVKVHVSHIFAKLSISSRVELAARAAAHDLTARSSDGLVPAPCREANRPQTGVIRRRP